MGRRGAVAFVAFVAGMAIALPAQAAPVSVGHSGWVWGNPRPQGNTLVAIDFAGGRGYASGAFGTLLRTDDNGLNWTGISTGLTGSLNRVRALDANTVVIGGGCALRRSDNGGQSFTRLPWTASDVGCPSAISSFFFSSPSTGYLLADDGSVFRTTDGGGTFARQTAVPGTKAVNGGDTPTDIWFLDDNTGIAITRSSADGRIFRTTDGANSWVEIDSPGGTLTSLRFVDSSIGFAVGGASTVLRTPDAGLTWQQKPIAGAPDNLSLTSLDCAGPTTCLLSEQSGARLLLTQDGGDSAIPITPSTNPVYAVAFASGTRAIAVGDRGATVVSDDSGMTWSPIGERLAGSAYGQVEASSIQIAAAGGANGSIARTVDFGGSWQLIGVPTTQFVIDTAFPTANLGYALDSAGGAFKTVNGGSSWAILNTGATSPPSSLLAFDAERVYLVGPRGIRRSTDGGQTFSAVSDKDVINAQLGGIDLAGGSLVAFGTRALLRSADGVKWERLRLPRKRFKLLDADFVSPRMGFLLDKGGRLWRTTNGGRGWGQLPALGPVSATSISFSSASSGFVSGLQTNLGPGVFGFHTGNGGGSFQPQLLAEADTVSIADMGTVAYAGTTSGSFFATATDGSAGTPSSLSLRLVGKRSNLRREITRVKAAGRLTPTEGGEQIVVSARVMNSSSWRSETVTAASEGGFTASIPIPHGPSGPVAVVAQWRGDDERAGAGSQRLIVTPPRPRPGRHRG